MIIRDILPNSIAEEAGLRVGDEVLSINGYRAIDMLDYKFYDEDDFVALEVRRGSESFLFEIEKDHHESLGMTFDDLKIMKCGNDCVFCFVDQNPPGMRHAVYFRDGDYRFSFLYGNFVTLTNVGPKSLDRIVRLRMSPIYVSVHSTLFPVRMKLMGMKKDDELLPKMTYLHDNGIDMHTQIVLCPGINDGESLEKTVDDLWRLRERVQSLSIVPVGLTDFRAGLMHIDRVTSEYANDLLRLVESWQRSRFKPVTGRNWMYASDEFYIVAGRSLPSASYYDGFGQVENGVGLSRKFIDRFKRAARRFPVELDAAKKITIATARLPQGFIREVVASRLSEISGLDIDVVVVENTLFGKSVTVAGLLGGRCFQKALEGRELGDLVLLPPDVLNTDGIFLDDVSPDDLSNELGVPVVIFSDSWSEVMNVIQGKVAAYSLDHNRSKTYLDVTSSALG